MTAQVAGAQTEVVLMDWIGAAGSGPTSEAGLSPSELERHNRLIQPRDRTRYTAAHGRLRSLTTALGWPAGLRYSADGQPMVGNGIHVSISYSGPFAALAASREASVGVDVEAVDRRTSVDYMGIARRLFHTDEIGLLHGRSRGSWRAFLTIWTLKEAVVKAFGRGLTDDLRDVRVLDGLDACRGTCRWRDMDLWWRTWDFERAVVAFVSLGRPRPLRMTREA